ncbi:MAG: tetratricopeptide repeat protein [Dongiaceae bacterium]
MTQPQLEDAIARYQRGENAAARTLVEAVLGTEPRNGKAWYLAGVLRSLDGDKPGALAALEKAVALAPEDSGAQTNLGRLLLDLGRPAEAVRPLKRATALLPEDVGLWRTLARAARAAGDNAVAIKALQRALKLEPRDSRILTELGHLHMAENDLRAAEPLLRSALEADPKSSAAYSRLAGLLLALGGNAQGRALVDRALVLDETNAHAHAVLSASLRKDEAFDAAIAEARRAIALDPRLALGHTNLALALSKLGRAAEALEAFNAALDCDPNYVDARWNRAMTLLKLGHVAEGFAQYEWRYQSSFFYGGKRRGMPKHPTPAELAGKRLLLLPEQGLGDTIHFLRYAKLAADRGAVVTAQVRPVLRNLAACFAGVSAVTTTEEPVPPTDYTISLMSMPFVMGTALETIPAEVPYVTLPPDRVAHWKKRIANLPGKRVGLCWQGNPQNSNDSNRSVPLAAMAPLLAAKSASFVSLQKGPGEGQLGSAGVAGRVLDPAPEIGDFVDTAALIQALDLVISVDTSIAHLAGALARPVWTLIPYIPDFRWMLKRTDSPWYPTMRLFRQTAPGGWAPEIDALRQALEREAKAQ